MLRKTAASVVASVALLSPGAVQAQPMPEQVVQAVADSAAETYRETRAAILHRYREQTRQAQKRLESASDPDVAWQQYLEATEVARQNAHSALEEARREFRETVALARG
jgi:hypothetical protein